MDIFDCFSWQIIRLWVLCIVASHFKQISERISEQGTCFTQKSLFDLPIGFLLYEMHTRTFSQHFHNNIKVRHMEKSKF